MIKKWKVVFSDIALKNLKNMDRQIAVLIVGYIEKNIDGCENPRAIGKPLKGDHKGEWSYRIDDYRILCLINDDKIVITVIEMGHRIDKYL